MKEHIQTFSKGISQDVSTNKYPNDAVYWAQNFRLVSKDGLATGALTNVAGNNKVLSLGGETEQVYEMCLIRDTLVIFVGSDDGGKIYIWEHNNTDFETESPKLVYYSPDLIFSMEHPVRAIGRYENEKVQKIYFSDGTTFFKHLNIVHPTLGLGAQLDYDLKSLDLVSDVNFSTMSLELESGGDLKAGKIQYAYQLYSVRGSESMFSPASKLIHLTNADESKNSQYYYGDEVGTSVNKSVSITIDSIDPLFTRLRLVALEYTVLYQQPSIRIVGEYDINNLKSITISDTGSSIGSLTNEEFLFIQNNFYPKTLDIKDDYLFAANILNDYFDITDEEFDARAWRANSSDEIYVVNGTNAPTPIPYPFSNDTIPAQGSEQFNSFNDISNDWSNNNKAVDSTSRDAQCKYKPGSGGTILGGAGINISYEFTIDQQILDNTQKSYNYGSVGGNYPKLSVGVDPIENNASPYSNIGYHRDEIYRFGIVFFDKKGRQSFVKWIGDIRFPANYDQDSINTNYNYVQYDSTNNQTLVNILGIKFTVNIPLNVQNKISGYQIVRAERTNRDKTIIAQGLIGYPTYSTAPSLEQLDMIYSQPTPSLMDNMVAKVSRIERQCDIYNGIAQGDKSQFKETNTKYDTRWIEFDSPDIVINKPKLSTTDSFIELFGYQNNVESTAISGTRGYEGISNSYPAADYRLDQRDILTADKSRNIENNPTVVKTRSFINTSRIYQPKTRGNADGVPEFDATKTVIEGGQKHNNLCYLYTLGNDSRDKVGLRGTHALLTVEDELPLDSSWLSPGIDDIRFPIANYRIERGRSMYGGSTSEDRSTTKYYPASEFVNMNNIPNIGDIDEVVREEITTAFTVKYGALPGNACTGTEATVYCAFTKPEVGDILYADESLTTPWTTTNGSALLFTSPAIFGNEVVGVAIVTGTIYALGEIMLKTTWACGNTPGYITDDDPNSISVFNGDTYISYFVYLRSIYDHEAGNGSRIETYVFYPVESTINLHLRLDKMQEYINWGFFRDSGVTDYKLMENVAMGISVYGTNYPSDVGNLYRYNTAYSSVDKSKEYYPKPFDFTQTLLEDVKITASEKKINGEYIDSWTKFKFNNYINVDSKHNAITKILTFKNNLYYVQPTAVGIASVNQRSLIQDGQPGQLSLGCVCAGTKVYKSNGEIVNIEDLKQDDGILGYKNGQINIEPITYIQDELYKECVEIKTTYRTLQCSIDHPILTRIRKSKTLLDGKVKEYFDYSFIEASKLGLHKDSTFICIIDEAAIFGDLELEDARLIGMLIGDGSYGFDKTPVFSNADEKLTEYITLKYDTVVEKENITKDNRIYKQIRIKGICSMLRKIGIYGQTKNKKRLPDNYQLLTRKNASELLGGLFDTDGTVQYHPKSKSSYYIGLCSSVKELLEEIQILLYKFGVHSNIKKVEPNIALHRKDKNPYYQLVIYGIQNFKNFYKNIKLIVPHKQRSLEKLASLNYRIKRREKIDGIREESIVSIKNIGTKRIYNLTANDSNTYIANGIITHNTGGILPRYDYITDKSGSEFYDGIIATDDFLFYVDGRRKRANKLVPGKEEAVSVIKGIDSTLDKLPFNNVSVGFDRGYNEVLFSIDGVTLSFSEISDGFVSTYTFNPGKMISIGGEFYTTAPFEDESPWLYADNELEKVGYSGNTDADPNWDYIIIGPSGSGTGLFKHNVGNPGEFYGSEGPGDSYLTLIINPNGNQVCYFDNLDLRTESTKAGVDQPDDIFYTMEASNNYQNISRELSFSSSINQNVGTVKRIGRVWRTPIMPIAASKVSTNRMVDTYLKVTLRYDNSSGNVFRVHDIGVMHRPANH